MKTMTSMSLAGTREALAGLRTFWDSGRRVERVAYAVAAILFASGLFHLAVFAVDGGSWQGPVSWRKPVTFGLSFGLTLATVTWAVSFLRLGHLARTLLIGPLTAVFVVEVFGITMQAWRGEASHFNEESPFDNTIQLFLAGGAAITVLIVLILTAVNLAPGPVSALPASLRLGLRVGWLTLVAAMVFGVGMVITATSRLAAPGDDPAAQQAAYTSAGWLKPAHAITMHAILILPALAWLISYLPWSDTRRLRVMAGAAGGYSLLTVVVAVETLARVTLFDAPWWGTVLVLLGSGAFALAGAAVVVALLRGPARPGLTHPAHRTSAEPGLAPDGPGLAHRTTDGPGPGHRATDKPHRVPGRDAPVTRAAAAPVPRGEVRPEPSRSRV